MPGAELTLNKIGLIEMYHHYELVDFWATIFAPEEYQLHFFLSHNVFKNISSLSTDSQLFIKQDYDSLTNFLNQHQSEFKDLDLIIITTIAADFRAWVKWKAPCPLVWMVHNQHAFFAPKTYRFRKVCRRNKWRFAVRIFKHLFLKRETTWRKKWIIKHPHVFFPGHDWDPTFLIYPHCRSLPITFFSPSVHLPLSNDQKINIAIPGTVRSQGRDYTLICQSLQAILPHLVRPIRLSFLGSTTSKDGQSIIKLFQQFEHPFLELEYSLSAIPPDLYLQKLNSAHFLLLPLQPLVCYSFYEEHMGTSKISGGVNDMIRSGRPLIIPHFYPLPSNLDKMTARYSNQNELQEILLSWVNNRHFYNIAISAENKLKGYQLEKVRARAIQTLKNISYSSK